jgi:hypothetical protein
MNGRNKPLRIPILKEESFKKIYTAYSSLGRLTKINSDLSFYHCDFWRNATMSPIFLNPSKNWKKSLINLETYFERTKNKSLYDSPPYFNLLSKGKSKLPTEIIPTFSKCGWKLNTKETSLNFWRFPLALALPKGIHLRIGNYFDREIYPHFLKAMQDNFECDRQFMSYLNKMIKGVEHDTSTTLLFNHRGSCIGAGLVATKNNSAFLYCGSINRSYRGKNLWKTLVAARQMVSGSRGAKSWITTTRVPQLLWRGDETYRVNIFTKIT